MVAPAPLTFRQNRADLMIYTVKSHPAQHRFCHCYGIHALYSARPPADKIDVKVDCLKNLFAIADCDHKSWDDTITSLQPETA